MSPLLSNHQQKERVFLHASVCHNAQEEQWLGQTLRVMNFHGPITMSGGEQPLWLPERCPSLCPGQNKANGSPSSIASWELRSVDFLRGKGVGGIVIRRRGKAMPQTQNNRCPLQLRSKKFIRKWLFGTHHISPWKPYYKTFSYLHVVL